MKAVRAFCISAMIGLVLVVEACAPAPAPVQPTAVPKGPDASKPTVAPARLKMSIMVGGLDKQIYLPAMLAKQLGFFDAEGLDVDLLTEPAGVNAETAMLAGQVDATVGFYDHTVDLQSKGKLTESVIVLDQVTGEVEMVATSKADKIKSPADFKGAKLGVTGLGSSTHFLTLFLAVKGGVQPDQVTPVAAGAGDTFIAAIKQGTIDAGMTTEPTISRLLNSGDAKILVDLRTAEGTKAVFGGLYPGASLYTRSDWVEKNKDTVQRAVNAFVKTLKWINTHTAAEIADKMPADYYAGDKDMYVKALAAGKGMYSPDGLMPADGPQTVLNAHSSFNESVKGKQIDLSKTYTDEFVKAASK